MKRVVGFTAVAAALLMTGSQAYADASKNVDITANVGRYCNITAGGTGNLSAEVTFTDDGTVDTNYINLAGTSVTCNSPYNMQVTSQNGGLKRPGEIPGGFSNVIDYTGIASFGGLESFVDTSVNEGANNAEYNPPVANDTAAAGPLGISIRPQLASTTAPLVAGAYSDTLQVTIAPQ